MWQHGFVIKGNNRSFIQHLEKVTIDRPYLIYENRKIFVFYDPPHLLKNVGNNLKKADLRIDEGVSQLATYS